MKSQGPFFIFYSVLKVIFEKYVSSCNSAKYDTGLNLVKIHHCALAHF